MYYTIKQGDALLHLPEITPGSVDAVITDPPYMIGAISVGTGNAKCGKWADMENSALWYTAWLKEAMRILKPSGFICACLNWRSLPTYTLAFARARLSISSLLVWDKEWIGPAAKNQLRPRYELVAIAAMPEAIIRDRSLPDIFACKWMAGHNKTAPHPAEKPVALMKHLLTATTQSGDVVLDPFMGSGTTGIASLTLGRKFIGFEREPEYFDIAVKRLAAAEIATEFVQQAS
jgi:site-specific DNA-methyltransferase (adenine-specific)